MKQFFNQSYEALLQLIPQAKYTSEKANDAHRVPRTLGRREMVYDSQDKNKRRDWKIRTVLGRELEPNDTRSSDIPSTREDEEEEQRSLKRRRVLRNKDVSVLPDNQNIKKKTNNESPGIYSISNRHVRHASEEGDESMRSRNKPESDGWRTAQNRRGSSYADAVRRNHGTARRVRAEQSTQRC